MNSHQKFTIDGLRSGITSLMVAMVIFSVTASHADDTDIYLGSNDLTDSEVLPNILLILDTSGSMDNKDGTESTRLGRMKSALSKLINSTKNANMGLMRFHNEGGPVLFPVSDLDKSGTDGKTVRKKLISLINELNGGGVTPIQDVLYEAARYWKGLGVYYGRTRGQGFKRDDRSFGERITEPGVYTRLSHPDSYRDGRVRRPWGCTDRNLNHSTCIMEYLSGSPTYVTPIKYHCQKNHQVLLSDGKSNYPHSEKLINEMVTPPYRCTGNNGCSDSLVKYLQNEDQHTTFPNTQDIQRVTTHTIGFNLSETDSAYLKKLAAAGDGEFYPASSASDLVEAFDEIFDNILTESTSLTAPALSVDAFNGLYHDNEIYYSLFLPKSSTRWPGNLKKYRICEGKSGDSCTPGEVVDATGADAIDSETKQFTSKARSLWSQQTDGNKVELGGAGSRMPSYANRLIYTYVSSDPPDNSSLDRDRHRLDSTDASAPKNSGIRTLLKGDELSDSEYANLVYWILGRDLNDEDRDSSTTDNRWVLGDSLHSSPAIVTYGKEGEEAVKKIFIGSNDGMLHMINAETGIEEWAFFPPELLGIQQQLMSNNHGQHLYGIDGEIKTSIRDRDRDGIIEADDGDHVWLFFGMRRGGRNLYALDVTPATVLTDKDATGGITPKLKWRILGGTTPGFELLGQTWSAPTITRLKVNNVSTKVLLFGGGYHPDQDNGFGPSNYGNAIYIVRASDGSLIEWISGDESGATTVLQGMDYPIPSNLTLLDADGDQHTDRIYVGDTGGQLWRIHLGNSAGNHTTTGGILAQLSNNQIDSDKRKFFYPPDVAQIYDNRYSSTAKYDLIALTSGDRSDPTEKHIHNRAYAIRDYQVRGPLAVQFRPYTHSDLHDATANLIQEGNSEERKDATDDLTTSKGWYMDLNTAEDSWLGEKGLSRPLILDGKLLFTTYLPEADTSNAIPCSTPGEGEGRIYTVNLLTAAAVYPDWDGMSDHTNLTRADRTHYTTVPGIPSEPVPLFQPRGITIIVGGGAGGVSFDPLVGDPTFINFWHQNQE